MTDDDKLTKYFNALTEIANMPKHKEIPHYEIFSTKSLYKCIEIAETALKEDKSYKQPELKFGV